MISPLETQMLPRQAEVPDVAVERTVEEKRKHALMILEAVKRDITSEKLPPAIENLIHAYERVGQNEHATLPQSITDNILKLKSITDAKLLRIQEGKSVMGKLKNAVPDGVRDFLSNKCQQFVANRLQPTPIPSDSPYSNHSPLQQSQPSRNREHAWQGHATVREEVAAVVQMVNASAFEQRAEPAYELENGEPVSEVVSLSRSVNYALESELVNFKEAVRAADNFDRVCHSAFGFSFYSEEFGRFCTLMADSDQDSDHPMESFLLSVESASKREHMRQMSRDHNLRNQFRRLKTSVLKDHLYKIIALVFVNEILSALPVNYKKGSPELYFESLQLACDVFLMTQLSYLSSDRKLRESIQSLMKNLHLIKVCSG